MSDETDTIEREIDQYVERLRKLSWYQMYLVCPAFFFAALIGCFQLYNSRSWWDVAVIVVCVVAIITNYIGARRTFVRLVKYKLGHTDES